ncbi:hypothetical protein KC19_11G007300 [Ceratodon purpureus]|uniref:Uncharacterized protein n=1 Tax=Ceratodon purpureus TaxID=3225 RepID=A0A8T0GCS3_CERPU|nr:hypothetical protein KC19_11G007300 [Ceratodon purpureus]
MSNLLQTISLHAAAHCCCDHACPSQDTVAHAQNVINAGSSAVFQVDGRWPLDLLQNKLLCQDEGDASSANLEINYRSLRSCTMSFLSLCKARWLRTLEHPKHDLIHLELVMTPELYSIDCIQSPATAVSFVFQNIWILQWNRPI